MEAIKIQDLAKYYGRVRALSNVSFTVPKGCIFGFLGANGAGKTTAIRIILGMLKPTSGKVEVLGRDVAKYGIEIRKHIGFIPAEFNLYGDMTGIEILDFYASFYQNGSVWRKKMLNALELSQVDLNRKVREYSMGMKQKIVLIQAFQHNPIIYILDEPTLGLDPVMQKNIHKILLEVKNKGAVVFMSSHNLSDVERYCERVAIIHRGKLLASERVGDFKVKSGHVVEVSFREDIDPRSLAGDGRVVIKTGDARYKIEIDGDLSSLLAVLSGMPVQSMQCAQSSLEDTFLKYYTGNAGNIESKGRGKFESVFN